MEVIRVEQDWQKAGAYYVRIQAMGRQHHIPLSHEFDEHDDTDARHLLITEEEFPIATCRWFEREEGVAEIGRVVVLPEYRGRNIGALVVQEAEKWLVEEGYHTSVLESRDVAIGFYEKLGYTADYSRTKQWDSFFCVHMEKCLDDRDEQIDKLECDSVYSHDSYQHYNLMQDDSPVDNHSYEQMHELMDNCNHEPDPGHSHGHNHDHVHSHEHTKAVVNRLSRAIGHLESVRRMVEDGRDCSEVLVQLSAVRAAINNTGKIILNDHLEHCIVDAIESGDLETLKDFEKAINQFIK